MGNRAILTLESNQDGTHPVALYLHWNGGLESVLAFLTYTWDTFPRGRDDLFTFHVRLCQVLGNFFERGLSIYALPVDRADADACGCDNGRFHFAVGPDGLTLLNRRDVTTANAMAHEYWTQGRTILHAIRDRMPAHQQHEGTVPDGYEPERVEVRA